jgi:hypothetical protein
MKREVLGEGAAKDPKSIEADERLLTPSLVDSTLVVSTQSLDPGETATLTLSVLNGLDEPYTAGSLDIGFRHSGGTATGTFGSVTDNGDGSYTTTFTAVRSGSTTKLEAYLEGVGVFEERPDMEVNFLAPPSALSYSQMSTNYPINTPITNNDATVTGVVELFTVLPPLPSGLHLDALTGRISGTPDEESANTSYLVTATNPLGTTTATLNLGVLPAPPSGLAYSAPSPTYIRGQVITANTPSVVGAVTSWSVTPALPSGLSLNTSTGVISGTVNVAATMSTVTYTVTATNPGGSATLNLPITIGPRAPTSLNYSFNPAVYTRTFAISTNTPTVSGGDAPYTYSITPDLPSGLTLSSSTGQITGTPNEILPTTVFTVTASNATGSRSSSLSITVNNAPPLSLSYTSAAPNYERTVAVTPNNPSFTGGTPTSYAASPALPAGLTLNATTGVITGTPTVAVDPAQSYTITASNDSGSSSAVLTIRVRPKNLSGLNYGSNTLRLNRDQAMTAVPPTYTGDTATSFSVSPSLPSGLSLDSSTGILSGTPTVAMNPQNYTVTAAHSGNSTTRVVTIEVWANDRSTAFQGGTDEYVTTSTASNVLSTSITQFSFQAWIKPRSSPSSGEGILGATNGSNGFGLYWNSSNVLRFFVASSATFALSNTVSTLGWTHVVGTYTTSSTGNIKIYVNGGLDASTNQTSTLSNLSEVLTIGRLGSSGSLANSYIDEVGVWNTALSAAAISNLYNGGEPLNLRLNVGSYTQSGNLRSYWRMGDLDTFPNLDDKGAANRDGTAQAGLSSGSFVTEVP